VHEEEDLALFLTVPLLFTVTTVLAAGKNLILSIEGFQKYAVETANRLFLMILEIKTKESALEDAKEDAEFLAPAGTKSERYNNDIKKEVSPLEAEANLEYAKRVKEKNIDDLKLDVYKAALDKLLVEKELDTEKAKLDILSENTPWLRPDTKRERLPKMTSMTQNMLWMPKRLMCRELKKVLRQRSLNLKDC